MSDNIIEKLDAVLEENDKMSDWDYDKKYLDKMVTDGKLYHYKCRGECFPDMINALYVLFNNRNLGKYKIIFPQLETYMSGEPYLDFYSTSTLDDLVWVWKTNDDKEYHRVYQTLNYADKYNGDVIN